MYRILISILFVFGLGSTMAQVNTYTPYSLFGIGDVRQYDDALSSGLGGAVTAIADSSQVNLFNPASYSSTARQLPLFSFGLNHFQKRLSDANQTNKGQYTGITHIALVLPIAQRFGIAAGLKPFSRAGFEVNDGELVQGDSIFYDYIGNGDIQEFLLGFSATVLKTFKHTLSLGVNGKYYFGKINNERRVYKIIQNNMAGGMDLKSLRANDFGVEFGLNYNFRPSPSHAINVAGTYRLGLKSKFEQNETRIFYSNFYQRATYDTIFNSGNIKGRVYLPSKTAIGLSYAFTPELTRKSGSTRNPTFKFILDYSMEDWANYSEDFDDVTKKGHYVNSNAFRAGFEYIPHRFALDQSAYLKYFEKMSYRIGGYFVNTPYSVSGTQIQDKGISIGLGFPFVISRATSTVNFSATYGSMGTTNIQGAVKEKYFGFNLGINIAPGYDRWFKKYKLD